MDEILEFTFEGEEAGRLDIIVTDFLATNLKQEAPSRSQIKRWIEGGYIEVNGIAFTKAGSKVEPSDLITINKWTEAELELEAYEYPLNVLFEDSDIIVINKPAGLTVHPGAGNKSETLVNALIHHFKSNSFEKEFNGERPGIVHRLDKDTSGVMVVAKNISSLSNLSSQFSERTINRKYVALAFSTPRRTRQVDKQESGEIEAPVGRDQKNRIRMTVTEKNSRPAVTEWRVIERMNYAVLLELTLKTGRTHQIRVHLNHVESPIIGDPVYGDFSGLPNELKLAANKLGRQALHAKYLEFAHPKTSERLNFESALPDDMSELISVFRAWHTK